MANDYDAPLRKMLRLLGQEYGDKDVAIAAFDALSPGDAKDLIFMLKDEPDMESGSWLYEITKGDVGNHNVYVSPIPDEPAAHLRINVSGLTGDVIKAGDVGRRISGRLTPDFGLTNLKIESTHQRNMRVVHEAHARAMATAGRKMAKSLGTWSALASDQKGQETR